MVKAGHMMRIWEGNIMFGATPVLVVSRLHYCRLFLIVRSQHSRPGSPGTCFVLSGKLGR